MYTTIRAKNTLPDDKALKKALQPVVYEQYKSWNKVCEENKIPRKKMTPGKSIDKYRDKYPSRWVEHFIHLMKPLWKYAFTISPKVMFFDDFKRKYCDPLIKLLLPCHLWVFVIEVIPTVGVDPDGAHRFHIHGCLSCQKNIDSLLLLNEIKTLSETRDAFFNCPINLKGAYKKCDNLWLAYLMKDLDNSKKYVFDPVCNSINYSEWFAHDCEKIDLKIYDRIVAVDTLAPAPPVNLSIPPPINNIDTSSYVDEYDIYVVSCYDDASPIGLL